MLQNNVISSLSCCYLCVWINATLSTEGLITGRDYTGHDNKTDLLINLLDKLGFRIQEIIFLVISVVNIQAAESVTALDI